MLLLLLADVEPEQERLLISFILIICLLIVVGMLVVQLMLGQSGA